MAKKKINKYLEIDVTKYDIQGSERSESSSCMIAVAARRLGMENVKVSDDFMEWGPSKNAMHHFDFPKSIQRKIELFDESDKGTLPVKPFKVRIPLKGI